MTSLATAVEHEQLAYLSHLLASQVYEAQGKHPQALAELRRLRSRQQRVRAEIIASRERVVGWQLEVRRSAREMQRLETTSRTFERLSYEDPLTGIANRRRVEEKLRELLGPRAADAVGGPTVAVIDVDRFKLVNDVFSHLVGDQVLKSVAEIMQAHVRQDDLPARLAGDEFVILFQGADEDAASLICERIRTAVARFEWSTVAEGLQVSISVGVAQARAGETAASLLLRADRAMYAAKALLLEQ